MILAGSEIKRAVSQNKIYIDPYNEKNVGPNSYDVRLGDVLMCYKGEILDTKHENATYEYEISKHGLILQPGKLYLGATLETIGTDFYVPMIEGVSSLARLGINIHKTAGFGDIGFRGHFTLEISVIHKVKIYPRMRIGQVYFQMIHGLGENDYYKGKYQNNIGIQPSKSFMDFK